MTNEQSRKDFEKPNVDEDYLMNIMSGEKTSPSVSSKQQPEEQESRPKEKSRTSAATKKTDYKETFLANRYPSGRNGKVVYIRPEYHERLLRIVQLAREDKTTLYSYIDNILEHHFAQYGTEITEFFNGKFKPIL